MIDAILDIARSQIGIKEAPPGSNRVKYCTWYGLTGPWCAMFTSWVYQEAGYPLPVIQIGAPSGAAYCPYIESFARKHGQWHSKPSPGDLALFHFGKKEAVHIGIVETVSGANFTCIEGNTSVSSNDNGGAVMRRNRQVSQCRGFYRPAILGTAKTGKNAYYRLIRLTKPLMVGADIQTWQKQINWFGYGLEVDGYYGAASKRVCEDLQQKRGLTVDGIIGPETWKESFERD
jgi:hypothetical protein